MFFKRKWCKLYFMLKHFFNINNKHVFLLSECSRDENASTYYLHITYMQYAHKNLCNDLHGSF